MDKAEGDMDGESPVLKHPKTPASEHTEHTEHTHNRGTNDDGTARPVPIAEQPSVVDVDLGDSELVLQSSTLTTRVPLLENGEAGTAIELLQRVEGGGGGGGQTAEQPEKEGLRETFENEEKKGENTKGKGTFLLVVHCNILTHPCLKYHVKFVAWAVMIVKKFVFFGQYWHEWVSPYNAESNFVQSTRMQRFLKTI